MKFLLHPKVSLAALLVASTSCLAIAEDHYLNIGDAAPALKPAKWLKGTPVKQFEKGKIYVVEFWATWCGPCKANIPHLTELAKKYKGQVSITGVSVWETQDHTSTAYIAKVADFVKKQGSAMDYNVAVDGMNDEVANKWMKAAGEGGIPASFIIGRDGKVAWIGYPLELGKVLDQVIANKFDIVAARNARALSVEGIRPVTEALEKKEYKKALEQIEIAVKKRPNLERYHMYSKLVAQLHVEPQVGIDSCKKIISESAGDIGAYRMVCSIFATYSDLSPEAYKYGKVALSEAVEKNEMKYMFMAMSSEVYNFTGDKAEAIKFQEQSIALAEKDSHAPAEFVEMLRKKLAKLKASK